MRGRAGLGSTCELARAQQIVDPALRVVQVPEVHAVCRADRDAGRVLAVLHAVQAEGALVDVALRVHVARVVGQAAMQALQPMHLLAVTCTVWPSASTWLAPVGQQLTHGGLSQWLQRSLRISMLSCGKVPRTSVVIQSRQ